MFRSLEPLGSYFGTHVNSLFVYSHIDIRVATYITSTVISSVEYDVADKRKKVFLCTESIHLLTTLVKLSVET